MNEVQGVLDSVVLMDIFVIRAATKKLGAFFPLIFRDKFNGKNKNSVGFLLDRISMVRTLKAFVIYLNGLRRCVNNYQFWCCLRF